MQQSSNSGESNSQYRDEEPVRARLLDELLESTLNQRSRLLSQEEWKSLSEIALGLDQQRMEECAALLIESLLRNRFPKTLGHEKHLKKMSENIAHTLCSDPTSRQRLHEFLEHLRSTNLGA